jgi:hypothetical protein
MLTDSPFSHDSSKSTTLLGFGLHPERSLRVAVLENVENPVSIAKLSVSFPNAPGTENGEGVGRFAIMAASRIMSLEHISVAANSALFREFSRETRSKSADNNQDANDKTSVKRLRGIALDTIFCAGGSLNEPTVLKEYGFQGTGKLVELCLTFE